MTAKDAQAIAWQSNALEANSQVAEIKRTIESAAKQGLYECYYYNSLRLDTKNLLESEGYKVSSNFAMNEILVTISWGK